MANLQVRVGIIWCGFTNPIYIEFVTAYIPDENQWQFPPFARLKR